MSKEMKYLMETYGWSQLTAWRHVRDREILRRRYAYQSRGIERSEISRPRSGPSAGERRDASAQGKIGDVGERDFRFLECVEIKN